MSKPWIVQLASMGAAVALLTVGPVSAGEVTGNGKPTPINSWVASSICAFSGQNDGNPPPGRVQNFGHTLLYWIATLFIHPSDPLVNPGTACNPS